LLYPEPKFHADRTILRTLRYPQPYKQTNKQTNKKSKLNITPNATLRYAVWRDKKKTSLEWTMEVAMVLAMKIAGFRQCKNLILES